MVKVKREDETNRERFLRLAESRTKKVLNSLRILGHCSNLQNYQYTKEDISEIFAEIEITTKQIKGQFMSNLEKLSIVRILHPDEYPGDTVEISKTNANIAQSIVLAPLNVKLRTKPRFESFIKRKLNNYPITLADIILVRIGISREITFKVVNLRPDGICIIKQESNLTIGEKSDYIQEEEEHFVNFDDIGGLKQ